VNDPGNTKSAVLVGLMSGTSLDGISAAVVRFTEPISTLGARIDTELLSFAQLEYTSPQRARIERAMQGVSAQEYCRLNVDLAAQFADAALAALAHCSVPRADVMAIASHGHTLWHEPGHSTWQLGDAATIAERTGCAVVSDFRARDVAAGGQGAPLAPMADLMLFAHDTEWRALQNIGGIANVTVVPPRHVAHAIEGVRAFDTGPGVVLIDAVTRHFFPNLRYDTDGAIARSGTAHEGMVSELLRHPYFAADPPKSTGRELFTPAFVNTFVANAATHALSPADTVATAVALTARSVADQYRRFLPEPVGDVVISGGGARNPALVDRMVRELAPLRVRQFSDLFFDGEAKEAVAFALLGYLHLTGRPGNVLRATGARASRQLGVLTPA
jgi:anhydro-N-acetylmuramic acid kinase